MTVEGDRRFRLRARASDIVSYLRAPLFLRAKLRRALIRRRSVGAYRARLAAGDFVAPGSAPRAALPITVGMPVFRVAEEHLRAAIASVRQQTHPEWELLLVDDASPDPHVARVLAEAARDDQRVRFLRRASNGGIAAASDDLVEHAGHEWLAFVDHDDLLHPRALESVAACLAAAPETDWLFTDEDKVDARGFHRQPAFKPGFSRHLLLAFNYVSHLRVVRRDAIRTLGGHRAGYEGAQDWDLALRMLASGARFRHLPGVLYHWRAVSRSMASAAAAKPAANVNAARALAEHVFRMTGRPPTVRPLLEPASLFSVRVTPPGDAGVTVINGAAGAPRLPSRRPVELLDLPDSAASPAALRAGLEGTKAPFVVVLPAGGIGDDELDELLGVLQISGTALAAGHFVDRRRVVCSGWLLDDRGEPHDPWQGLSRSDPGYLNLALAPGPRSVPPPSGWAAHREVLVEALARGGDAPDGWVLPLGLHRLGVEAITTPTVAFPAGPAFRPPPAPRPEELPATWPSWADELALLP